MILQVLINLAEILLAQSWSILVNLALSCQTRVLQDALARSCQNDRLAESCKHMHLANTYQDDLQEMILGYFYQKSL